MLGLTSRILRNYRLVRDYYMYDGFPLVVSAIAARGRSLLSVNNTDSKKTIIITLQGREYEVLTEFPSAEAWRQYGSGIVEPEVKRPMRELLSPNDLIIDIGGFCGDTCLYAHSLVGDSGRVISVEPDSYLADIIQRNVDLNGLTNIDVLNIAVGEKSGELPAEAVLGDTREAYRSEIDSDSRIDVRTLSKIISDIGTEPDLVKVDVDGAEYEVLKGARDLLGQFPILLELHNEEMLQQWGETTDMIFDTVSEIRYMGAQGLAPNLYPYGKKLSSSDDLDRSTVTNLLLR